MTETTAQTTETQAQPKKQYEAPVLTAHDTVTIQTLGSIVNNDDGQGFLSF